ncbi:MFS transporter [Kocuria soli]|uniref:MFS transporter n=1 Tax=Kocuria soli TaxID=2485125 RepID=A0A3N3ZVA0_9MICC|nr:MFS transporter [Kocuria soli]
MHAPRRPAGSSPSPARLRVARVAASGFFLVNGAVFANLLPRLPEVKEAFGLSNTVYGLLVIAFPIGSIAAGMAPAPLLRRFGSARVAGVGSVLLAALVAAAGAVGSVGGGAAMLLLYAVPIVLAGVLDAIVDTAQNAQAIDLQKSMGRSVLNSMHALWSLGAMVGGIMGSAAVGAGLALPLHLGISGAIFSVLALLSQRFALTPEEVRAVQRVGGREIPGPNDDAPAAKHAPTEPAPATGRLSARNRAIGIVILIGVIAIAGAMIEDLAMNWSTLLLSRVLDAPGPMAGMGLVAMMAAQFLGRLLGDRMTDRFGRVCMAKLGGTLSAVGLCVVALAPAPAVAVVGFAVAGFGCATLVPSAFHAADSVPGLRPGTGLTLAGWLLRVAFLSVSPFVGVVSDAVGLRLAIMAVPVVALVAVLVAGVLRDRDDDDPRPSPAAP